MQKVRWRKILALFLVFVMFGLLTDDMAIGNTTMTAEAATGYPYLIKVNRKMCTVTIYKKDSSGNYTVPIKVMVCSPGWDTPLGTFRTPAKYRWQLLMGDVWGQYCTRIHGGILFHSVWYYERNEATLSNRQYNNLGTVCSHGCIRLNVQDVKWIYDNCPLGTTVVIYDSNNPGPLGKGKSIKVSTSSAMGYDPTDIWAINNPYKNKKPVIAGAKNKTIIYGSKFNVKQGVTAKNTTGLDATKLITTSIRYNGKNVKSVNTKKAGKYYVTYKIKDEINRTAQKKVVITVKGDNKKPDIYGVKSFWVSKRTKVNRALALKNVTARQSGVAYPKAKIKTKIQRISKYKYRITYTVTSVAGKVARKRAYIRVDAKGPSFYGAKNKTFPYGTRITKTLAMKGVTIKDNYTPSKDLGAEVSIKKLSSTRYSITYKSTDGFGNVGRKVVYYTVQEGLKITGLNDIANIPYETEITKEYVISQGVKAYNNGKEITDQISVEINQIATNQFKITCTVYDKNTGQKLAPAVVYTKDSAPEVNDIDLPDQEEIKQ